MQLKNNLDSLKSTHITHPKMSYYSTFLLCAALVASVAVQISFAATLNREENAEIENGKLNQKEFTYLGQMTGNSSIARGVHTRTVTSYYFLSQNAAGYSTAETDCKAYLSEEATLLYIETQEELGNVTRFLQSSDDTGATYWVGGKYNPDGQKFVWNSGAEMGPWAPWDKGHPNSRLPVTRVSAYTTGGLKLRTQFQTVSNRYICELRSGPIEEEPVPCYSDNDLVVVVDSSGSIGQPNYMVALEFTTRLALAWADNPGNRLAVIVYSNSAKTVFDLGQHLSVSQIRDKVYSISYMGGGTASDLGLVKALEQFEQHGRSVTRNMVFLTDGASNNKQATAEAAKNVNDAGVRSFSVGIGSGIGKDELLIIAGNKTEHVFNADGFADLLKLLQPVSLRVCN